jgi:flagellar biosynthetic protein FliR
MAALGLVARAVPQMNVFTLSFPVSFFMGLMIYLACFPFFPAWMETYFADTGSNIYIVLKGLKP